jgi:hypothetical protein
MTGKLNLSNIYPGSFLLRFKRGFNMEDNIKETFKKFVKGDILSMERFADSINTTVIIRVANLTHTEIWFTTNCNEVDVDPFTFGFKTDRREIKLVKEAWFSPFCFLSEVYLHTLKGKLKRIEFID